MRVFKQPRESKNCAASPCWYATDARTNVLVVTELRRCLQRSGVAFARPLLPLERGRKSWPAFDNRQIVNGILWRIRTGTPWRDLPEKYGNQREKAIASCLFAFAYFRSSTRRRFLLQFGLIVINSGTDELF
jgi:hypothetical protein